MGTKPSVVVEGVERLKTCHPNMQDAVIVQQDGQRYIQNLQNMSKTEYDAWRATVGKVAGRSHSSFQYLPSYTGFVESQGDKGYAVVLIVLSRQTTQTIPSSCRMSSSIEPRPITPSRRRNSTTSSMLWHPPRKTHQVSMSLSGTSDPTISSSARTNKSKSAPSTPSPTKSLVSRNLSIKKAQIIMST